MFQEIIAKGNKLKDEPKCPEFLGGEVKKATDLWTETNNLALDRLNRLRGDNFAVCNITALFTLYFRQSFCLGEV